jgi:hypothetical protein
MPRFVRRFSPAGRPTRVYGRVGRSPGHERG